MKRFSLPFGAALGALALVGLGFGLRMFRLSAASMTGDENWPWILGTKRIPAWLHAIAADDHPPLYYFILRPWTDIAGPSELAYRIISVFAGILTIAVLYQLGSKLFGRRAGLLAAALLTLAPQHVDFSQEARMYTLLTALCLGAALCLWQALTQSGRSAWKAWLGYVLLMSGAIHTHYFGWLFWCTAIASVVLAARGRKLVVALAVQGVTALTFVPWTLYARVVSLTAPSPGQGLNTLDGSILTRMLNGTFNLAGTSGPDYWIVLGTVVTGGLAALGLWLTWRSRAARGSLLFTVIHLAVPIVLTIGLSIYSYTVWYRLFGAGDAKAYRYLMPLLPWGCALVAAGLALARPRAVAYAALAVTLVLEGIPTGQYLLEPLHGKNDYREMVNYVRTHQQPGDGVFLLGDTQGGLFPYYGPDMTFSLFAPDRQLLTTTVEKYRADISRQAKPYTRLWVLVYGALGSYDPGDVVGSWLSQIGFITDRKWFHDGELRLYALDQNGQGLYSSREALVGDSIRCEGVEINPQTAHPGETIRLTIYWKPTAPIADKLVVFSHVLRADGTWVAGTDGEPAAGSRPTPTWTVGETIVDRRSIALPPDLPPGTYTLQAGFVPYDNPNLRLPVTGPNAQPAGDAVWLGTLEVTP
jgi:mannosyltransferase